MKDGLGLALVKGVARRVYEIELGLRRRWSRLRGESRWRLGGECGGCARCCEEPALRVPGIVARLPFARSIYLGWQSRINGFELEKVEDDGRLLIFRCTHFDLERRRCDSYATRPFICRDYPRALLEQPWPELFDGCGYRAVDARGEGMARALEATDLDAERLAELKRKLRVE